MELDWKRENYKDMVDLGEGGKETNIISNTASPVHLCSFSSEHFLHIG